MRILPQSISWSPSVQSSRTNDEWIPASDKDSTQSASDRSFQIFHEGELLPKSCRPKHAKKNPRPPFFQQDWQTIRLRLPSWIGGCIEACHEIGHGWCLKCPDTRCALLQTSFVRGSFLDECCWRHGLYCRPVKDCRCGSGSREIAGSRPVSRVEAQSNRSHTGKTNGCSCCPLVLSLTNTSRPIQQTQVGQFGKMNGHLKFCRKSGPRGGNRSWRY